MFYPLTNLLELCKNLDQKIKELEIENAELKERLGLNSKNSSLSSSKELYKIKKGKPKSERNIGGQVEHKGNYLAKMDADKVVKVENYLILVNAEERLQYVRDRTFIRKLIFRKSALYLQC